jgi:hypothetical protein
MFPDTLKNALCVMGYGNRMTEADNVSVVPVDNKGARLG